MSEERTVIEPPCERPQRFAGALLLGMTSFSLGTLAILLFFARAAPLKPGELPMLLLCGAMVLALFGSGTVLGARMALETQTWIVGRDFFERRSEILGFGWGKIYRASAWRLEHLNHNGSYYVLNPVEAGVGMMFTPFFSTSNVRVALRLGRQLALATGWPLRLSSELRRLEKELQL